MDFNLIFSPISYTYNTSSLDYSNNFKTLIKRIKLAWRGAVQGIRTQIVKSNSPLREPNNDILAIKMV